MAGGRQICYSFRRYRAVSRRQGTAPEAAMSVSRESGSGKITVPSLLQRKTAADSSTQKITCLTAYDYPTARLLDESGVDVLLVGDSVGMVVLGYDSTIPVTLDMMIHHTAAVSRGASRALIVADMPFLTYQLSAEEAMRNAGRLIKEGGA